MHVVKYTMTLIRLKNLDKSSSLQLPNLANNLFVSISHYQMQFFPMGIQDVIK